MRNPSKKKALAIRAAMTFHAFYCDTLDNDYDTKAWRTWAQLRDEKLADAGLPSWNDLYNIGNPLHPLS